MVTLCENCKNFIKLNKLETFFNGSKHFKTKDICKLNHKISLSKDGWIPRVQDYICKDFNPK